MFHMLIPFAVNLLSYSDGPGAPPVKCATENGFVSRVVSDVADRNEADARALAAILNEFFARGGSIAPDGISHKVTWPGEKEAV